MSRLVTCFCFLFLPISEAVEEKGGTGHPIGLGATQAQVEKLYGKPVKKMKSEAVPAFLYQYHMSGFSWGIQVYYRKGRVGYVTYQKIRHADKKQVGFAKKDIAAIGNANRRSSKWISPKRMLGERVQGLGITYADKVYVAKGDDSKNEAFMLIWKDHIQVTTIEYMEFFREERAKKWQAEEETENKEGDRKLVP